MIKVLLIAVLFGLLGHSHAQNPIIPIEGVKILSDSIPKNGQIDRIEDMVFRAQVPFEMPDGVKLQTDVYLPIFQDDMGFEFDLLGMDIKLNVLKKGSQFIIYDSINGGINPNPFQLPMIFTRSPYNKKSASEASIMTLLGYTGVVQDLRGRYASEGVFFPLYSDSWNKTPYYSDKHILDINPVGHPQNPENFEDGANSLEFIKNNLMRTFDLDGDGVFETTDLVYSGAIGMFGASALGYSQTQAAASRKIDPTQPGLKAILPIVATGEFQKNTLFPNGVFREQLVTGWLKGQMTDLRDELISIDNDIQNDIHTSFDFGLNNKDEVTEATIDNYSTRKYSDGKTLQMPTSIARKGVDISYAPVNEFGEGDADGQYSRYSNMEVPSYYLSGWWDIFVDGTLETFMKQKQNVSEEFGNKEKIKLVVGPWAHETITSTTTGDATYPKNVMDVVGASINDFSEGIDLGSLVNSELFSWYRYTLNNSEGQSVGLPKFLIPEGKIQRVMQGIHVRVPSKDYKIPFSEMLNFMMGSSGLKKIPVEVRLGSVNLKFEIDVPKLEQPLIPVPDVKSVGEIVTKDFSKVAPLRFYVVGPMEDDIVDDNKDAGNYWFGTEDFPLKSDVQPTSLYLHSNGSASFLPSEETGILSYNHNPDQPVISLGGANMLGKTPEIRKGNFGQIDYSNPIYKPYVLENPDVLIFETPALTDTMSIIGFPKAVIYGTANPENAQDGDPTDVDFFVRIIDVYPDGREMFVVEGGVNARAREYAKTIAEGNEDINAPFSNIKSGKMYEYFFDLLPIGYTFGKEHKVKVIISSSNHPRYQSNPCIPLNEGEFFRRKPNEDKTYVYDGKEMTARKSVQQVYFSPSEQTKLILPIYGSTKVVSIRNNTYRPALDINVYPNPTSDFVQVFLNEPGRYQIEILNVMGQTVKSITSNEQSRIDVRELSSGAYILKVQKYGINETSTSVKFIKK
ncbi:MAG TPA: CocE/NonD family hydrolase [Chitinophagales bacterium]|nr:CocE/NonD family hydrolase [Chitinophagales bacterium]